MYRKEKENELSKMDHRQEFLREEDDYITGLGVKHWLFLQ